MLHLERTFQIAFGHDPLTSETRDTLLLYNWSGFTQVMEQDSEVGEATAAGVVTPAEEGLSTLDTDEDGHLDTCNF